MKKYKITRFFFENESLNWLSEGQTRERNLTLCEAQAHCRREDTRGDGESVALEGGAYDG